MSEKAAQQPDAKTAKDLMVLSGFIAIFCREKHRTENKKAFIWDKIGLSHAPGDKEVLLCESCTRLLRHGIVKRLSCPHNPKPMCKNCKTPCYAPGYREEIKKVMRFSGFYLVRHGRLDLLFHYLF